MLFYLGTHQPRWLGTLPVPLFVSRRRLVDVKTLPSAMTYWALDSGAFTELSMHGKWTLSPKEYAGNVRRFNDEIGFLRWAAPQDWMCEPHMLKRTGLSIETHQKRTVANVLRLRDIDPTLPFAPVLQGWTVGDYMRCAERYEKAGIDLSKEKVVGVGSVCRRQATAEAAEIFEALHGLDLRLHGFGVKQQGLVRAGKFLHSSDSMAWSFTARRADPLPGHDKWHKNCANCVDYALRWRTKLLERIGEQ